MSYFIDRIKEEWEAYKDSSLVKIFWPIYLWGQAAGIVLWMPTYGWYYYIFKLAFLMLAVSYLGLLIYKREEEVRVRDLNQIEHFEEQIKMLDAGLRTHVPEDYPSGREHTETNYETACNRAIDTIYKLKLKAEKAEFKAKILNEENAELLKEKNEETYSSQHNGVDILDVEVEGELV